MADKDTLTKPENLSEEEWAEHLKQVDAYEGFDGLSRAEVSKILLASDTDESPQETT